MPYIRIHIHTPEGKTFGFNVQPDLKVKDLVRDVAKELQLGDPNLWRIEDKGKKLDGERSLQDNGVHQGNHLDLRKEETQRPRDEPSGDVLTRCDNGHFFDAKKHPECPECRMQVRSVASQSQSPEPYRGETRPTGQQSASGDPVTRAAWKEALKIDPVVGWLVCVHGPDKGRSYPILMERNSIGRDPSMGISIGGDTAISRENHAFITFEPTKSAFYLSPGEGGRGLVFLNDDALLSGARLKAYDQINLGRTKLFFVPFCGEHFRWTLEEPK